MHAPKRILRDRHYTYTDYLRFPDDERWELIDGVAYCMPPAPTPLHQTLTGEIYRQTANQLVGKPCRVFIAPIDVRFARELTTDKVVQPDVVVIGDRAKIDRSGIIAAPDWIVEVLSPSTAGKDQILKRSLYEREGVREFWLVHPVDRLLTIYRLNENSRYGMPEITELSGRTAVQSVPGIEIDWSLWEPIEIEGE